MPYGKGQNSNESEAVAEVACDGFDGGRVDQNAEEFYTIPVIKEYLLPFVSPARNVVQTPWVFYASRAPHKQHAITIES